MRKIFKVPDHWRSTEWQNEQYLKNTAQAKMYTTSKHPTSGSMSRDFLPQTPIEDYEEPALHDYSLKKKIGASVLAMTTLIAPSGSHTAMAHNQPIEPRGDTTSQFEVCYDRIDVSPATQETHTFIISDAHNDALSEEGKQIVLSEFENSPALHSLRHYTHTLPEESTITKVEVHGTASDDNRSNVEAGIGRGDEINQRTATSYAGIATQAIKKLLGSRASEVEFHQSAEEKILTADERYLFDTVRQKTGLNTNADLLTAYNEVKSSLGEQHQQTLDQIISQHRGVEVTVHTQIPEQSTVTTACESAAMLHQITPAVAELADSPRTPHATPAAILPTWSRVTRQMTRSKKNTAPSRTHAFGKRMKWRAGVAIDNLKYDWSEFQDNLQFIGRGIANAGREMSGEATSYLGDTYKRWATNDPERRAAQYDTTYYPTSYTHSTPLTRREQVLHSLRNMATAVKDQADHFQDTAPDKLVRLTHRPSDFLYNTKQSIEGNLQQFRRKQSKLNQFAKIPTDDLGTLGPNEFYAVHRVFPSEYSEAMREKGTSLRLRRALISRLKKPRR